ncbi:hypothetical protein RFI_28218 [Reticulomyxa filosa]|uniref:Uncharacterized protein n=1 Tax=Reticulomyxa filosa TaxID=46433 RepID=X6M813_RETFI|nr:hypothetical protein RFI_28218 [Reticulomyxa filosa]|eukprot:ETO09170.1 hypothetical protein RFI_28218 [Reticulomyxa filosa]
MDANKDEAERCLEQARHLRAEGRYTKALKYATISQRLYPCEATSSFISELQREKEQSQEPRNANNPRGNVHNERPTTTTTTENEARTFANDRNGPNGWNIRSYLPNCIKNVRIVERYQGYIKLLAIINLCLLLYRFVYLQYPIDWFSSNYHNPTNVEGIRNDRYPSGHGRHHGYRGSEGSSFFITPFGFYMSGNVGGGFSLLSALFPILFILQVFPNFIKKTFKIVNFFFSSVSFKSCSQNYWNWQKFYFINHGSL